MKKTILILMAAAALMTACAPTDSLGNNNTDPPAIGEEGMNGGEADGGTVSGNGAAAGTADKGSLNTGSDSTTVTGGVSDGASRRDAGAAGTSMLGRRTWNGLRRELPTDTLGDLDGDGKIENRYTERMEEPAGSFRSVTKISNTEDARNFIGANVLSLCRESLPEMAAARVLRANERNDFSDRGGLIDADGVRDVIVSEASDGADFTITMLRTDGSHTRALSRALGRRVDVDKWHRGADKTVALTLDDDIVLLSGDEDKVDAALLALVRAADGVYRKIGDARVVTG